MEETHKDTNLQSSSHFEHDTEDGANYQTNDTKPIKKWLPKHSNVLKQMCKQILTAIQFKKATWSNWKI